MSHSNMVIDFQSRTVSITPYFDLLSVSAVVVAPRTTKTIKAHLDQEHQNALPEKGSLIIEENNIDSLVCEERDSIISDGVADITITNKTDERIVVPAETKIGKGRLIALRDNVLQTLKEAIDFNLSIPINDLEGVTNSDNEYWDAINKIDLDKSQLTLHQKEELFDKIFNQRGALALKGQVGALKNFYYDIKMKENAKIYNKESYRMNPVTRQIMKSKIESFVNSGIATRLMSQYSSPALLIKKPKSKNEKDPFKAEYRVVIDLREMNTNAIHLQYTLPIIHELVTELDPTKNAYYSLLDISDAFYQIQLHPDSYKYTTFRIPGVGSYCLTRLPQGYVGGPSVFQAVIENIFPDNLKPYLTYYIDDILIMTDTPEKHIWVIERVLFTLRQHGMKLKIQKCQICPEELDFLGITLCSKGTKVKFDKCEAIQNFKIPRTKKQVRSFLGSIGYYRRYIKNFALIARPLHALTRDEVSNSKVPWNDTSQLSFDTLKDKLANAPILGTIDYSRKTILRTDASGHGIGATLVQNKKDGSEVVIAYYSRVLQPHEFNYDVTTREALAVLSAVRQFATYLRFVEDFVIQTDHVDLKYIFKDRKSSKQESHRLIRWALYLSGFPCYIQFCSGNSPQIRMVDFLSRHNYEGENEAIGEIARKIEIEDLKQLEDNCPDCGVDCYEKVSEDLREIIPDEIQLKEKEEILKRIEQEQHDMVKIRDQATVGFIQSSNPELLQIPEIHLTSPKGKITNLTSDMNMEVNDMNCESDSETSSEEDNDEDLQDTELPRVTSESFEKENEFDNFSDHEHVLENENNDNTDNEQEDIEDDQLIPSNVMPLTEEELLDYLEQTYPDSNEVPDEVRQMIKNHLPDNNTEVVENEFQESSLMFPQSQALKYIPVKQMMEQLDEYDLKVFDRWSLKEMQGKDPLSNAIMQYIESEELPPEKRKASRIIMLADQYFIDNTDYLLYHIEYPAGGLVRDFCVIQLYIPEELVNYVIKEVHAPMHLGRSKMIAQIRQKYWFPRMGTVIDKYIQNCHICQLEKHVRSPFRAPLKTRKIVSQPGEVWYLDHMGPIILKKKEKSDDFNATPETDRDREDIVKVKKNKPKYILIAVDSYSMYVELSICKGTTAAETADLFFKNVICRHSWPKAIVHDQGTAFVNKILAEFTRKMGIKNYQTAAMNPRSNGLAESRVKIVSVALAKLINERQGKWTDYVHSIQFGMNSAPSQATCVSPFFLQHGRFPNDPLSMALLKDDEESSLLRTHAEYCGHLMNQVSMWGKVAKRCRRKYNEDMEKQFRRQIRIPDEISVGEMCYLHVPYFSTLTKGIRRLNIPWRGPFAISQLKDNEKRLVKLIKVSDLSESEKWYPVHRLKLTKYGLDPPMFPYIEGFTVDYELSSEGIQELTVDKFLSQPWDDNTLKDDGIQIMPCGDEVHDVEEIAEETTEELKEPLIEDEKTNDAVNTDNVTYRFKCKIPPRIRSTRAGQASCEPIYRNVNKFYDIKEKDGIESVLLLCENDKTGYKMWINRSNILPINETEENKKELEEIFDDLRSKKIAKNLVKC